MRSVEARANRPAFDAEGGYGGSVLSSYAAAARGRWGYGAYVRLDALQGAVYEDSPLVQTKNFWSAGLGVSYRFHQSQAKTRQDDGE